MCGRVLSVQAATAPSLRRRGPIRSHDAVELGLSAWGTDILFDAANAAKQGAMLSKMVKWYSPAEALAMATSANGQLLARSGLRSPYPGKLGVVEEGAFADLLLVDGNPIDNIKLIEDPERNFVVIMKDGRIYKNTVRR